MRVSNPHEALAMLNAVYWSAELRLAVAKRAIEVQSQGIPTTDAVGLLADALGHHLAALHARLHQDPHLFSISDKDGCLRFDAHLLDYLRGLGDVGRSAEETLRDEARSRWQDYMRPGQARDPWEWWSTEWQQWPAFALHLAGVLWGDVVLKARPDLKVAPTTPTAPSWQTPAAKKGTPTPGVAIKFPAVSAVVLRRVIEAFFAGSPKAAVVGPEICLFDHRGHVVAAASGMAGGVYKVEEMASATRSLLGQRLFRYLVNAGATKHDHLKTHDHRVLRIEGGLSGLASLLGVESSKSATELRSILDAFKHLALALPHGKTESLLDWSLEPENQGQRAVLHISLHDALLPGFVTCLPKVTRADRDARKLVPIPMGLPQFVGSPRSAAPQALLQLLLLEDLTALAEELATKGVVFIPGTRWESLAKEAGVSRSLLEELYVAWVLGPAAWLKREPMNSDTYTLATSYGVELQCIVLGGEKIAKGRARQALAAKK